MSNDNDNAESLELQKVLAASLAFTQKEFRRAKRELIEEFKEVLDPDSGEFGVELLLPVFITFRWFVRELHSGLILLFLQPSLRTIFSNQIASSIL